MRRREFITAVAATVLPLVARSQERLPVVGLLGSESRQQWMVRLRAFFQGLREAGFLEGSNVATEYRFVDDQKDPLPALAADLVARRVTVIAGFGGPRPCLEAKALTSTIPIVFTVSGAPVRAGLVASLAHPGANITGATTLNTEVGEKRLELLHELLPTTQKFALLINRNSTSRQVLTEDLPGAAQKLGVQLEVLTAGTDREIDEAFEVLDKSKPGGLVIGIDSFLISRSDRLAALALRHAIPAVFLYREFAAAGGLMSYGGSSVEGYRLAGAYTGRILKGERVALA
jgi:putative ABC transport system substrate-binding protein